MCIGIVPFLLALRTPDVYQMGRFTKLYSYGVVVLIGVCCEMMLQTGTVIGHILGTYMYQNIIRRD